MPDGAIPKHVTAGAVDLAKVADDASKAKQERETRALAEANAYAERWGKAMHRAFKGTIGGTRAQRRRALLAAMERQERGA